MSESSDKELSSPWCIVTRHGDNVDTDGETTAETEVETTIPPSTQLASHDAPSSTNSASTTSQDIGSSGIASQVLPSIEITSKGSAPVPVKESSNTQSASEITYVSDTKEADKETNCKPAQVVAAPPGTLAIGPVSDVTLQPTPDISIESEATSSDHSDFEVFEQDCGGDAEEENDELENEKEVATFSHEQRIRLALNNLRGTEGQIPTPIDTPHAEDVSSIVRQVAEPPRVQIIRLNADEESLPESDIQLEEAQGLTNDQYDVFVDDGRVRRYQHLPNSNLNARLNNLVLGALLFVIGLAVGHFIGSTHERFSQHYQRVDCLDRMKSVQVELLRCAQKYDEMELQLNEVKATLVQKEYVDKWESLYQEGEEEKATLTATMNLYKNRYLNQQKVLEERMERIKSMQNDLLRCSRKYEQLELKQNDQKATLVQKEYVDKWESLYQEGEEEKAALTATMNLYKSRYNKEKQLLTQCEVHYQDLQEHFNKFKLKKTDIYNDDVTFGRRLPSQALTNCEEQREKLSSRVSELKRKLQNCTRYVPPRNLHNLFFHTFLGVNGTLGNNTKKFMETIKQKFNFTSNFTQLTNDWLTVLSKNHSARFGKWMEEMRQSVNASELYETMGKAAVSMSENVERMFDIFLDAITKQNATNSESFYQRMKNKVDEERTNFSNLWKKTVTSTREVWNAGIRKAKETMKKWKTSKKTAGNEEPTTSFREDTTGVEEPTATVRGESAGTEDLTTTVKEEAPSVPKEPEETPTTEGEATKGVDKDEYNHGGKAHPDGEPSGDWYWKRKTMNDEDNQDYSDTMWYTKRRMRRAQQRVRQGLNHLSDKSRVYVMYEQRNKLREKLRKKSMKKNRKKYVEDS